VTIPAPAEFAFNHDALNSASLGFVTTRLRPGHDVWTAKHSKVTDSKQAPFAPDVDGEAFNLTLR
jgi:hypothetical protein